MARERGCRLTGLALASADDDHYVCDVAMREEVDESIDMLANYEGRIDGLACFQRYRGDGDLTSTARWQGELDVQLSGTRNVIEAALPFLAPSTSIVLTASASAHLVTSKMSASYHVAKAGLVQLARYYACQLGPRGVRVNCVCPGTFTKPETEQYWLEHAREGERLARATALGRLGTAREVAEAVLFLLSEQASFITGASLVVDGGVSCRWPEDLC